jgi:hypothetical protein
MKKTHLWPSIFLILVSMWWGWTVLVDMFIIRTVFASVSNFFEAGELGIAVFTKLNNLELIVATALVGIISFQISKNKKLIKLFVLTMMVWIMAMSYFAFLTPKLVELTQLWKQSEQAGLIGSISVPDIQQAHQYYHNLYIALDVVKLILLSVMLGLGVWKQEDWT